jgi:hypothetical protein
MISAKPRWKCHWSGLRAVGPLVVLALCLATFMSVAAAEKTGREVERAVNCQLSDQELPNLLTRLKQADGSSFGKPASSLALPTVDIYSLAQPVVVQGIEVRSVAFMPARLLAVMSEAQGAQVAESASAPLLLEINPWTAATDFGLFDGRRDADFDGSFRYYARSPSQTCSMSL